MNENEIAVFS